MIADVPVGAFLSAGIDSGTLVGLMAEVQKTAGRSSADIQTITLAFAEFKDRPEDESGPAAQIADLYGTAHTTRVISRDEFQQDLPRILQAMDQPTIDGINTWFVSKAAKEQGIKVVLSGLGGDELFGGYPSFKDIPAWVQLMRPLSSIPLAGELLQKCFTCISPALKSLSPKTGGLIQYGGTYSGAWFLKRGLFMPWELNSVLDPEMVQKGLARLNPFALIEKELNPHPSSPFARVAVLESCLYMRNQLLRDTDWASMAHSLEIRVPLVDPFLLKQLAPQLVTEPGTGKTRMGKTANPPLPPEILSRKKTGFMTPMESWLENSMLSSIPCLRKKQHWSRSWALSVGRAIFLSGK
jgi:asparagine synthase (glutamine-hydrolysing)